jgi:heme/copper-type cytochrome/quinol oxidase subunit 3
MAILSSMYQSNVTKKRKGIQIFLAVSFFLFFSVFSAFLLYNNCVETEFPSPKPKFENSDQAYLLDNKQNHLEILGLNTFTLIKETTVLGKFFLFSQISSLNHVTVVLRC